MHVHCLFFFLSFSLVTNISSEHIMYNSRKLFFVYLLLCSSNENLWNVPYLLPTTNLLPLLPIHLFLGINVCMYLPSNNVPFVKRWCQKNVHSKTFYFFVISLRHRLYYSFSLLNETHVLQCFRVQNHVFYYFILKAKSWWKIIFHSYNFHMIFHK